MASYMKSDEFNAAALDTATWTTEDPIGGTTFSVTGTQVSMAFAFGASGDRDMYTTGCNGSRIVQFTGDVQYFDVQAKFDTLLDDNFKIAGLCFWESTTRFLRADNYYSNGTQRYFSDITVGGGENLKDNGAALVASGSSFYLRVTRAGTTWTFSESANGTSWTQRFTGSITFTLLKWGLVTGAGNPGGGYPATTGLVDWVHVNSPDPSLLMVNQQAIQRASVW